MLTATAVSSQPPAGQGWDQGPPDRRGRPREGGPPRLELGRVLPPPVVDDLRLTKEQRAEIANLEKGVKERLAKILTAEQMKKVENFRPGGPGGVPRGGADRRGRPDRPGAPERPAPSERPEKPEANNAPAGIQWSATWESGLREAQRTGRPILRVSAAPHCAAVPGTW